MGWVVAHGDGGAGGAASSAGSGLVSSFVMARPCPPDLTTHVVLPVRTL